MVDLFAGPGGLGEGFAACRGPQGEARYEPVLSIESDPHAHRTLRLRAFLRKFNGDFPEEYYTFLNDRSGSAEPGWKELDPDRWCEASRETVRLKLGTPEADCFLAERISEIRKLHGDRTVLLGGPPCQAYSVVGRARNAGVTGYDVRTDPRFRLYEQYVDVLARLRPAVAVMENVKGLLSASLSGERIFPVVLAGLRYPRNVAKYSTHALLFERSLRD